VIVVVIVIVTVAVIAPVIVAALVNGNDTVIVIAPRGRSRIDQPGQHRHDTFKQLDPSPVALGVDQLVHPHDVEMRSALHRRAPCDRVVPGFVGSRCPAAALSDVLRNRLGGATKLIGQVRVPLG
jgi:hypothetical protein